jgi:hypothetical protein
MSHNLSTTFAAGHDLENGPQGLPVADLPWFGRLACEEASKNRLKYILFIESSSVFAGYPSPGRCQEFCGESLVDDACRVGIPRPHPCNDPRQRFVFRAGKQVHDQSEKDKGLAKRLGNSRLKEKSILVESKKGSKFFAKTRGDSSSNSLRIDGCWLRAGQFP